MTWVRAFSRHTFRSLQVRNYRLFFWGQLVSLSGTWMQAMAQSWLVLRLGGRGTAVGVVAGLQFLPMLLAGPWGGVVADRFDKRRTLLATQSFSGAVAVVLTVVTATGVVELWMVFAAAFLTGCAFVIDAPTRQSFVVEMVGAEEMTNAIGLNSAIFNAARVVGPALGGALVPLVGVWPCFLLNAVSFAAVIAGLLAMRAGELFPAARAPRQKGQVRAGLRYVWSSTERRTLLVVMAGIGVFAFSANVVFPLLARFTFDGDARTLGALTTATGIGSLAGALAAAGRRQPSRRVAVASCAVGALAATAAAAAPELWMVLALLTVFGAGIMVFVVTANALLQLSTDAAFRGRVMAIYAFVFVGSTPIGSPAAGWIAEHFGPRPALAVAGFGALGATAFAAVAFRRGARRRDAEDVAGVGVRLSTA